MITGPQIRAARAFLDWRIADLAKASGISETTIRVIESAKGLARLAGGLDSTRAWRTKERAETLATLQTALETAGVSFLPETAAGPGVRCKPDA